MPSNINTIPVNHSCISYTAVAAKKGCWNSDIQKQYKCGAGAACAIGYDLQVGQVPRCFCVTGLFEGEIEYIMDKDSRSCTSK